MQEQKRHCKCREPENFSGQEHFRERVHSTTSMAGKAEKCKLNDKLSAARFRLGYWCFCDPGSDLEIQRRATISPFCWRWMTVSWDDERTYQQTPSVQVFGYSSSRCISKAKAGWSLNAFQKTSQNIITCSWTCLGVQSTLFVFAVKRWIQNKMPVQFRTSIQEWNQEEVTALTHYQAQVCAVGDHLLHHEQSIRAVGDHCLTTHHQFVLWVTMCFLSQAKSLWKKYLNKRRKNMKTSQEEGFSNTLGWVNSSERYRGAMLKENGLYRLAKN